jgi:hypothetical protein
MPAPSPFAPFIDPLERLGLPYCITGSVAASVYGEPRLTADIDVVLLLHARDIAALQSAFPEADYYVPPEETLRLELSRRIELEGGGAWIAPPEYVVLRKLEYLREGGQDKHVRDIRFVLAATEVDRSFIEAEFMRLGLQAQWTRCQTEGPNVSP